MATSRSPLESSVSSYSKQIEALRSTAEAIDVLIADMLANGRTIDEICVEGGLTMEFALKLQSGERFFDVSTGWWDAR